MRRKAPNNLPRLPMSAFSPPNSATSDSFLPASPSTLHPTRIIDGHVVATGGDLTQWKKEAGPALAEGGVVLNLQGSDVEKSLSGLEASSDTAILGVVVPFTLGSSTPPKIPSSKWPVSLSTVYADAVVDSEAVLSLKWALETARAVDVDIQCNITEDDTEWEKFQALLAGASENLPKVAPIVLSNVLPPPHDLTMPIVKLMNHTSYRDRITVLSLIPNLYVKFLPPLWDVRSPSEVPATDALEKSEWKRRIKMFLGPVLEAFGFQRVIFGSSPPGFGRSISNAGGWYEIARESLAELGVEQQDINDVFFGNAQRVYSLP